MSTLLEARALRAVLPGDSGDVAVLDDVSLDLAAGEVVDVVGPSGSGKSTLLRALARLLPGATGTLRLEGRAAEQIPAQSWRTQVALLPQKPALTSGSVRDNLLLPWTLRARRVDTPPADAVLAEALKRVNLDVALDRDVSRLSVGQVARVTFLRTLLTSPRVLLLDEPDAALDDAAADAIAELTAAFAAGEVPGAAGTPVPRAVVRVRHHRPDGIATRRTRLEAGRLTPEPSIAEERS